MFIDSRDLRLLAAQGLSMAEIARELKQPYYRVRKSCQLLGVDVRWDVPGRPPKKPKAQKEPKAPRVDPHAERNAKMVTMYRQGLCLEKIGQTFAVTRERVRQVLRKQGVAPQEGGRAKSGRAKADAKTAKQDSRYLARHGLTFAQYKEVLGTGLLQSYRNQENSAKSRGIEWGLNFAQWLDIWKTSGKLEQRGRGKGKYVMSRIKDEGGYVVGNVHIQLATENSKEAVAKWRGKHKANIGVFCLNPGLSRPWLAKVGKEVIGRYATEEEAVQGRNAAIQARGYVIGNAGRVLPSSMRKAA
jgi:hypothetical protein